MWLQTHRCSSFLWRLAFEQYQCDSLRLASSYFWEVRESLVDLDREANHTNSLGGRQYGYRTTVGLNGSTRLVVVNKIIAGRAIGASEAGMVSANTGKAWIIVSLRVIPR